MGFEPIFCRSRLQLISRTPRAGEDIRGPPAAFAGVVLRWFLVKPLELRDAGDGAAVTARGDARLFERPDDPTTRSAGIAPRPDGDDGTHPELAHGFQSSRYEGKTRRTRSMMRPALSRFVMKKKGRDDAASVTSFAPRDVVVPQTTLGPQTASR